MVVIPTLSSAGFVPVERGLDYLFADALTSDYSQTDDYSIMSTSIPAILEKAHPTETYARDLEKALMDYFSRHYDNVTVDCRQTTGSDGYTNVSVMATVESNGKKQDLRRTIFGSVDSNSFKIIRVLNGD